MAAGSQTCQVWCCVHNSFLFCYVHSDAAVDTKPLRRARSADNYELALKRKIQPIVGEAEMPQVSTQDQPNGNPAHQNRRTQHTSGDEAAASDDHAWGGGTTEHHTDRTSQGSISGGTVTSKNLKYNLGDHPDSSLKTQSRKAKKGNVKKMMTAHASNVGSMKQPVPVVEASPMSQIDICRAVPDLPTAITLMLRHIACRYSQNDVVDIFGDAGLAGTFNFLHLPLNTAKTANLGYLFVNFTKPEYAESCRSTFHGRVFGPSNTSKICEVCASHTQGLAAIMTHIAERKLPRRERNSHIMVIMDQ